MLLLPPKELWLFLGCCSSSFSGIFASGAALEKQGENHSSVSTGICLRAPAGMRSPTAASLFMCCKGKPPKHQQIPCHLSGNPGNRSSCWNISSLCFEQAFRRAPDNPGALQGGAVSQQLLSALLLTKFLCPPRESRSLSSGIRLKWGVFKLFQSFN